jgi:hypothetical protein
MSSLRPDANSTGPRGGRHAPFAHQVAGGTRACRGDSPRAGSRDSSRRIPSRCPPSPGRVTDRCRQRLFRRTLPLCCCANGRRGAAGCAWAARVRPLARQGGAGRVMAIARRSTGCAPGHGGRGEMVDPQPDSVSGILGCAGPGLVPGASRWREDAEHACGVPGFRSSRSWVSRCWSVPGACPDTRGTAVPGGADVGGTGRAVPTRARWRRFTRLASSSSRNPGDTTRVTASRKIWQVKSPAGPTYCVR